MENKFFGNYFQLIGCFEGFDSEMVWSENFHFKPFTDSHAKRERERERESPDHSSDQAPFRWPQTGLVALCHTSANQAKINSNAARTTPIDSKVRRPTPAPIANRTAPIKQRSTPTPLDLAFAARFDEFFFSGFCFFCVFVWPDLMNFFSGFCFFCVFVLMNDIIYLFGSWENVCNK